MPPHERKKKKRDLLNQRSVVLTSRIIRSFLESSKASLCVGKIAGLEDSLETLHDVY